MSAKHVPKKPHTMKNAGRTRPMKASTEKATVRFGLVANGSSGAWDISIDETRRGNTKWYADIEGPSLYLSFQLLDLAIVEKMIAFLDRNAAAGARSRNSGSSEAETELTIGHFGRASVSLMWDDEHEDRCFLVIGPQSHCCMRFPLWGEDRQMVLDALRQAREDFAP